MTALGILYEKDGRNHLIFTTGEMLKVFEKTTQKYYFKVTTFDDIEVVIDPMSIKKMKMVQI